MSGPAYGMNSNGLNRKMCRFGLTHANHRTKITEYPCVRVSKDTWEEVGIWCQSNFGDNWIWSSPTQTDYCDIYFIHEQDAVIFKLTHLTA